MQFGRTAPSMEVSENQNERKERRILLNEIKNAQHTEVIETTLFTECEQKQTFRIVLWQLSASSAQNYNLTLHRQMGEMTIQRSVSYIKIHSPGLPIAALLNETMYLPHFHCFRLSLLIATLLYKIRAW